MCVCMLRKRAEVTERERDRYVGIVSSEHVDK